MFVESATTPSTTVTTTPSSPTTATLAVCWGWRHHGIHVDEIAQTGTHPSSGRFHRQREFPLDRPELGPLAYPRENSIDHHGTQDP